MIHLIARTERRYIYCERGVRECRARKYTHTRAPALRVRAHNHGPFASAFVNFVNVARFSFYGSPGRAAFAPLFLFSLRPDFKWFSILLRMQWRRFPYYKVFI